MQEQERDRMSKTIATIKVVKHKDGELFVYLDGMYVSSELRTAVLKEIKNRLP